MAALKSLASVNIPVGERGSELPGLNNGDSLFSVRLRPVTEKGKPIVLEDLEFWQINYSHDNYEQIKQSAEWPVIIR